MKRPVYLVLAAVVLLGGLAFFLLQPRGPHRGALHTRELAARGLAEHLAQTFPGRRALVISNPYLNDRGMPRAMRQMEEAGLRGLKEGFGTQISLMAVAFPELKAGVKENPRSVFIDPETTTPLSYLVAEDAFDNLLRENDNADLVVSLIGLPADQQRMKCWQGNDGPKFALLLPDLRVLGSRAALRRAMEIGKLCAFVLAKAGAPETPPGGDVAASFAERFVLVTPENAEQMMRTYSKLFPLN